MGSGLIYVVIVALWAVVLVPMWLNRHDANTETRSVDRFSSAMRSLSRRDNETKKRQMVMPARDEDAAPKRSRRSARQFRQAQRSAARVSAARAAASRPTSAASAVRHRQARRKAVVLSVLFIATLLAVVCGVIGIAPMWVIALPALLLVGYLWLLRSAAKRASMARARARRRSGAAGARPVRVARSDARSASYAASARADQADTQVVAMGRWEPVPVPLPTYVTAATATEIPRIIDLTHPGSWTTARMLEQAEYEAAEAAYERRMAAGMADDGQNAAAPPFFDDDIDLDQVYDREVEDLLKRRAAGD